MTAKFVFVRGRGRAFAQIAVITRRNLLANVRLPDVLILSTVQPVVFMLMFSLRLWRRHPGCASRRRSR
jgi:hypothetical protein